MRRSILLFFLLFFLEARSTNEVNVPLPGDIVTLTRMPVDKLTNEPLIDNENYRPITAAEAFTVFSIANLFLGGSALNENDFKGQLKAAFNFDSEQFKTIEEKISVEKQKKEITEIFSKDLEKIFPDSPDLINKIVENKEQPNIVLSANIKGIGEVRLKEDTMPSDLKYILSGKMKKTNFLSRVVHDCEKNENSEEYQALESSTNSFVEGSIQCSIFGNINIEYTKVQPLTRALDNRRHGEEKLKQECFKNNSLLFGYLKLEKKSIDYYWDLYQFVTSRNLSLDLQKRTCLLVVNELFFEKNFLLPNQYPEYIPSAPDNVISCLNFLLSTDSELPNEARRETSDPTRFDTDYGDTYEEYRRRTESFSKFFRSVSVYKRGKNELQRFTKGSYREECDIAIKGEERAYLFGNGNDIGALRELISTQICFDLSCGVRSSQKETVTAPIHIIQSNRLDITNFLLQPEQPSIPGRPKVIVHADPSWQEVFVPYQLKSLDLSDKNVNVITQYAHTNPKSVFTFYINKGRYKDAYTITHWELKGLL